MFCRCQVVRFVLLAIGLGVVIGTVLPYVLLRWLLAGGMIAAALLLFDG